MVTMYNPTLTDDKQSAALNDDSGIVDAFMTGASNGSETIKDQSAGAEVPAVRQGVPNPGDVSASMADDAATPGGDLNLRRAAIASSLAPQAAGSALTSVISQMILPHTAGDVLRRGGYTLPGLEAAAALSSGCISASPVYNGQEVQTSTVAAARAPSIALSPAWLSEVKGRAAMRDDMLASMTWQQPLNAIPAMPSTLVRPHTASALYSHPYLQHHAAMNMTAVGLPGTRPTSHPSSSTSPLQVLRSKTGSAIHSLHIDVPDNSTLVAHAR
ncbi:hypothetical protein CYMTET_6006 [Cymbomonas tetramitiformis]|uniref:Uncharacterized protein n=1 Tax=Cymbomonas tetramitiformis TaxID=36881 RepID=A0AAE0GY41_9CHLO|nr:hypothetical protein CYMTET_6006 [Cymbomonas tetramitiformis]